MANAKIDVLVEKLAIYLKKLGCDDRFSQHIKEIEKKDCAAVIFSKLADKLCKLGDVNCIFSYVSKLENIPNSDVVKLFISASKHFVIKDFSERENALFSAFAAAVKNLSNQDVENILKEAAFLKGKTISFLAERVESLTHEDKVKLIDELVNHGDADAILSFAENVNGLTHDDITKLIDAEIQRGKCKFIFWFASRVKGLTSEDLIKLTDAFVKLAKTPEHEACIVYFANIKGLSHNDVVKLMYAEIKLGNAEDIKNFAKTVKGLTNEDLVILRDAIIAKNNDNDVGYRGTPSVEFVVDFAAKVNGLTHDDKVVLMKEVIKTGIPYYITMFAANVGGLTHDDKVTLLKAVIKIGEVSYITEFAETVKGLTEEDFDFILIKAQNLGSDKLDYFNKWYSARIDERIADMIDNL